MLEDLPILSFITFIPLVVAIMLVIAARLNKGDARETVSIFKPLKLRSSHLWPF